MTGGGVRLKLATLTCVTRRTRLIGFFRRRLLTVLIDATDRPAAGRQVRQRTCLPVMPSANVPRRHCREQRQNHRGAAVTAIRLVSRLYDAAL